MPVNVAQLVVSVGANTAMAEQGIMGLARMLGAGGPLAVGALGAGLAVAGIGVAATKMAGDFQTQLTQIVTGAGESQKNLKLISDGVLQMARDTGTGTKQLTDGLYMIESAGYHGADALKILQAAAEGAKVGNADLGTTADAVTTIMKDYGATGITASQATNALIATVANGKTHMQDLAGALSAVLPAAQAAGVGLNDVMAAMAAQTAAGVPAADAATHLRQLIISLEAPSSAAKKALGDVGLTTGQVAAEMHKSLPGALQLIQQHLAKTYGVGTPQYVEGLKNISGGMREMQGMMLLTSQGGMASFESSLKNISGQVQSGGAQIQGWNLVQGTFNQQMSRLGEIFQTLMITLGTKFLPIATQVATFLANTLSGALSGVAAPANAVAGAVKTTGESMTLLFTPAQNTVGLLQQVQQWAQSLAPQVQQLAQGFGGVLLDAATQFGVFAKTTLIPMLEQIGTFIITTVAPAVLQFAQWLDKNLLPAVFQLVDWFKKNVLPILETFVTILVRNVIPQVENIAGVILTKWLPPLKRIMADILPVLNPLLQFLGWLFQNVIGPGLTMAAGAIGSLLGGLADLIDGIKRFVDHPSVKSFEGIIKGISNAGAGAANVMTGGIFSHILPHFASGGVMDATGPALVGEAGPELVTLPGGAQVTPLSSGLGGSLAPIGAGMGGFGGSAQPIVINQTITLDGRVLSRQTLKYMPNEIRNAIGAGRGF